MQQRIVFVNHATGYLTIDIINAFAEKIDEIAFIYGDIRVQEVNPDPKAKFSRVIEKSRKSNRTRLFRWLIASIQIFFLLMTKYRNYEIFYFSVPPFAYLSSILIRRKFSLLMWDVYPDALKLAGINEKNPFYGIWSFINRRLFKRAHRIFTIGNGQAKLISKYVDRGKVEVINLWSGFKETIQLDKGSNPFIKEHNLTGKFIVEYSGNMGSTHNIEVIVNLASFMLNEEGIVFILIGRGTKMEDVRKEINKRNLSNILLLPFQPDDFIKYTFSAADISVVLVDNNASSVSVPSKIYNLLAVGSPILAISPKDSEVNNLIEKYKFGCNFRSDDLNGIYEFIKKVKSSPEILEQYRKNAFMASNDFKVHNALKFVTSYFSDRK